MANFSEDELVSRYRVVLEDQKEELGKLLQTKLPYTALQKTNAFTKLECDTIRDKFADRKAQAQEVVKFVREKDILSCYLAFSRVVCYINEFKGKQIFPFVSELGDLHPPLRWRPLQSLQKGQIGTSVSTPPDAVVIIWLVAHEVDCGSVHSVLHDCNRPYKSFRQFQYQEVSLRDDASTLNPAKLYLVHLQQQLTQQLCNELLETFTPRPHLVVLLGGCVTISEATAHLGDVVVVTRSSPTYSPLFTELKHMTELWKLKGEGPWLKAKNEWALKQNQMQALARLYAELKSPEEERTKWYQQLNWDNTVTMNVNRRFMEYTPDLPQIVQITNCWKPVANDVLPYAPSPSLLEEAHASMLYAPQSYPLIDSSLCGANVVFGKATALREEEGAIVSCPDAVKFYCASEAFSIRVVAVMEVTGHVSSLNTKPKCETQSCTSAAGYALQVIKYLADKIII